MQITITKLEQGQRVDKFIRRWIKEAPLSFIYKMFRQKDVKINGKKAKIDQILAEGDVLDIYLKPDILEKFKKEYTPAPVKADFKIIYEDQNILVADKPAGLLVHADENQPKINLANMFVNYLIKKGEYDPKSSFGFVPGPAHRLDRNTSGIVILGKNLTAMQELLRLFRERDQIEKEYLLLCVGQVARSGRIDMPLKKDAEKGLVRKASLKEGGKTAITDYSRIKQYSEFALVKAKLITGRTHQLRAHFAFTGHPIVGDGKYGDFKVNKEFSDLYGLKYQFLHAGYFKFLNPTGPLSYLSGKQFVSSLPEKLENIVDGLK